MSEFIKQSLREFWKSNISKIGVLFLLTVISISVFTITTMPLDYGTKFWSNPVYWVDNPKASPPEWVNMFSSTKLLPHTVLTTENPIEDYINGVTLKNYVVNYNLAYEQFPEFFNLKLENLVFYGTNPVINIYIIRPDSYTINLLTFVVEPPFGGEQAPYERYTKDAKRFLLSGDNQVARSLTIYLMDRYDIIIPPSQIKDVGYETIIFGERSEDGSYTPLTGTYTIVLELETKTSNDNLQRCSFILGGQLYGMMGTDSLGRDLASGLLFGFPVALLIGFATSVIVTIFGATLGIISGYMGGKFDEVIQRVSDIINNFPQLPLLIFLTFIFGGHLWVIVMVLVFFGWPGLTIVIRSMILSIKQTPFIEAAIALGSSKTRIMARHIFPQVAPFILSQLIFQTPAAILGEAALSFLGLGDPSIPTWGQILEYGFRNGAVYLGYWWWILPPGLLIVFSAITFVFIAMGLEPVVNPRLRRWN